MDYKNYQPCLDALEQVIFQAQDTEKLSHFDAYRGRLKRAYAIQDKHGLDQSSEISRIFEGLDELSRNLANKSFDQFCDAIKNQHDGVIMNLGDPATLDLEDYDECLETLLLTSGLIGVSVTTTQGCTDNFRDNLKRRLQAVLASFSRIEPHMPATIHLKASIEKDLKNKVADLKPNKLRLKTTDVLLTVIADDGDRLERFWDELSKVFSTPSDYCFLVLIIKEKTFQSPPAITQDFPPPDFERKHVVKWVNAVVNDLTQDRQQKRKLILDWTNSIMQGCSCQKKQQLYPDRVYEHIKMSLETLQRSNNSIDHLYQFFDEWKEIYVQTPT
ncbi:hypothetical protein [Candidatus Venteria ishoeyi]|uniref:Uncharacterized protein n=1 Tax=Candidatus Venteria ishoeyi TaxID=1899563 RepID=A0A1H6FB12_9GAMM|nr:hypothetical protein [Candidatus Venteria ishoeyi]SEH06316.1 Uncharacterised protein [Candidatus Venteria ishoeyi]